MKMTRLLLRSLVASSVVLYLHGFGLCSLSSGRPRRFAAARPLRPLVSSRLPFGGRQHLVAGAGESLDSSAVEKLRKQSSAAKKKQQSRATRVRQNLNLPADYGDRVDALNAAARSIMTSMCVAEEYDTAALVEAMPGNAILVRQERGPVAKPAAAAAASSAPLRS